MQYELAGGGTGGGIRSHESGLGAHGHQGTAGFGVRSRGRGSLIAPCPRETAGYTGSKTLLTFRLSWEQLSVRM